MIKEKFIYKWHPIENISGRFYLETLCDNSEGLKLTLKSEETQNLLTIQFKGHLAYRNTDESERYKTIDEFDILSENWTFFILEKSCFKNWLVEQSYGIQEHKNFVHYLIGTPNDMVDILSLEKPIVDWVL